MQTDSVHKKIEQNLAFKLGIPSIRAGNIVIRDERNWRINEMHIEYCWLALISRSFTKACWIFSIKFSETNFREINNPDKLVQGIFTVDDKHDIETYFDEKRERTFIDPISKLNTFELFNANKGITLDGVSYEYLVFAPNTEIKVALSNPKSKHWKIWEQELWHLATELSKKSDLKELTTIFGS